MRVDDGSKIGRPSGEERCPTCVFGHPEKYDVPPSYLETGRWAYCADHSTDPEPEGGRESRALELERIGGALRTGAGRDERRAVAEDGRVAPAGGQAGRAPARGGSVTRTDADPGETHPGLWRPNGGLIVRSHHALRDGARRKLERWLTSQRIHWGYRGESRRCLVVYAEREWLESKLRRLGWTTLSVERAA